MAARDEQLTTHDPRPTTHYLRLRRIFACRRRAIIGDFIVDAVEAVRRRQEFRRISMVARVRTHFAAHARRFRRRCAAAEEHDQRRRCCEEAQLTG
jgi:hypothetical protein